MSFPGKKPGLDYWRTAAREKSDVEPIRNVLLSLDLPQDLKVFIQNATQEELRARVIRPIRWVNHFGPMIAADLRKRRLKPHTTWHLDEGVPRKHQQQWGCGAA